VGESKGFVDKHTSAKGRSELAKIRLDDGRDLAVVEESGISVGTKVLLALGFDQGV